MNVLRLIFLSFSLLFVPSLGWSDSSLSVKRVQAHLIIKDYTAAYEEAKQASIKDPDSVALHEGLIRALAKLGNEKEMLKAWEIYAERFPEKKANRELIEEMCWGVLEKGANSSALIARLMSLLAAYFSQDAKGVEILYQGMNHSNAAVRAIAVKLAGHFRDTKLLEAIKRLFKEEKAWIVRKEVIPAVGKMKLKEFRSELEGLIASSQSLTEEKVLAIEALVSLLDDMQREEIVRLSSSPRAGLRLLACQAIGHFRSMRDQDQLMQLAQDHHFEVRAAALQALGLLRPQVNSQQVVALAQQAIQDTHPRVAISAAWLLTLYAPLEGQQAFKEMLVSENRREIRILAASALAATGRYGLPLMQSLFRLHVDPYVRLNLALGLVGQRVAIEQATEALDQIMKREKEKWIWTEQGIFRAVAPQTMEKGEADAASTPEMENQLVRLELLNTLAILKYPSAQESIRQFLAERTWGISGIAAAVLLMEGDEEAIGLVQHLLQDSQGKIRLQAALILSLWGREESAIQVLEQEYWQADKELKERILEGLGRIGSMRSVPFLIEVLKEPSQGLRIIAAMALIQCLNH